MDEDELLDTFDDSGLNLKNMMEDVRLLLEGLGEDVSRDGLLNTPLRVARTLISATQGHRQSANDIVSGAIFAELGPGNNNGGTGGMVVVRNIDMFSTCESCLLPFRVRCHIAYIPSAHRIVGLSKLPRVAEMFASRLQNPQRLACEITQALSDSFKPLGVAIFAECWHPSWPGSCTCNLTQVDDSIDWVGKTVYAGKGEFDDVASDMWTEFTSMLQIAGVDFQGPNSFKASSQQQHPCPFFVCDGKPMPGNFGKNGMDGMTAAVRSLLTAIGEDPNREELKLTPLRFVRWLLISTQGSRGVDVNHQNGSYQGEGGVSQTVLNIPFCSQCEHHLLPFSGVVHVAYMGQDRRVDRLLLQKVVRLYSRRLQVQERLTRQIAETVMSNHEIKGVMVVIEASHICMISRGVKKMGSTTATVATLGDFACDSGARSQFFQTISDKLLS